MAAHQIVEQAERDGDQHRPHFGPEQPPGDQHQEGEIGDDGRAGDDRQQRQQAGRDRGGDRHVAAPEGLGEHVAGGERDAAHGVAPEAGKGAWAGAVAAGSRAAGM